MRISGWMKQQPWFWPAKLFLKRISGKELWLSADANDFIDAPAYTIATMMELLEHEGVDLLKMDVEGAEYDILEGLKEAPKL
jgi:FkbM family methyltransferase